MDRKIAALIGFLFALPFILINFIVSLRIEPLYSFLGSFPVIRNSPFLPMILLLLFPIGAFIAIHPMFASRKKKFYLLNSIVAAILFIVFLMLFIGLGEEMYKCDILKIPNCD